MKSWQLAVLGLALLTIAGCRSDPAIAILERDNYRKDREINQLRWQIEDLQEALNSCPSRAPAAKIRRGARAGSAGRTAIIAESNGMKPPETEFGTPTSKPPKSLNPGGSLPSDIPDVPENIRNPTRGSSNDEGPVLEGDPDRFSALPGRVTMASATSAIPFRPSGDSRRVASIAIDPAISGGIGSGDGSGDRGLLVAVQPRDARGRAVDAPAEVSVSRIRSVAAGRGCPRGPLGFHPRRDRRRCSAARSMAARSIWRWAGPSRPPQHNKLQLFVRYVTADGRKLEATGPVEIALPGERTARWTPAERPMRRASSRRSNGSRRPIRGVRTRRRWRGVRSPRPTSPRARPNRGPSGRSGRPSGDKLPLGRFAVSCYNSRSTPAVRRGRREDAAAEPIKGVMPCTYVLFSAG